MSIKYAATGKERQTTRLWRVCTSVQSRHSLCCSLTLWVKSRRTFRCFSLKYMYSLEKSLGTCRMRYCLTDFITLKIIKKSILTVNAYISYYTCNWFVKCGRLFLLGSVYLKHEHLLSESCSLRHTLHLLWDSEIMTLPAYCKNSVQHNFLFKTSVNDTSIV